MPRPKSKGTNGTTKADLIRQAAKSSPKSIRPRNIIASLKAKGIEVTSGQVSKTLRALGFRLRRRRRRRNATLVASRISSSNGLNLDALLAAKALIQKVGSVEAAEEALRALKRLAEATSPTTDPSGGLRPRAEGRHNASPTSRSQRLQRL
jgi:hypothetical protein